MITEDAPHGLCASHSMWGLFFSLPNNILFRVELGKSVNVTFQKISKPVKNTRNTLEHFHLCITFNYHTSRQNGEGKNKRNRRNAPNGLE